MIDTIQNFNDQNIPVDVLWMDIEYSNNKRYFEFDFTKFGNIHELIELVEKEEKRLTVITDPHIKIDNDFFVYKEGKEVIVGVDKEDFDMKGIFVRSSELLEFEGDCWPGNSVWVDFLNE